MKPETKKISGCGLIGWMLALALCTGILILRVRYPQKLTMLQQAVFGMEQETVTAVFGAPSDDRVIAVGVIDAEDSR